MAMDREEYLAVVEVIDVWNVK